MAMQLRMQDFDVRRGLFSSQEKARQKALEVMNEWLARSGNQPTNIETRYDISGTKLIESGFRVWYLV